MGLPVRENTENRALRFVPASLKTRFSFPAGSNRGKRGKSAIKAFYNSNSPFFYKQIPINPFFALPWQVLA